MLLLLLACVPAPTSDISERECVDVCQAYVDTTCGEGMVYVDDDPATPPLPDCAEVIEGQYAASEGYDECPEDAAVDTDPYWDSCHVHEDECREWGAWMVETLRTTGQCE